MVGGWIVCISWFNVGWVLGGWVSRVSRSRSLGFFGGFCDSLGGEYWVWVWFLVRVIGLLRVVSVYGGGAGGVVWMGFGWMCFLLLA